MSVRAARPRGRALVALALLVGAALLATAVPAAASAGGPPTPTYRPPVDAPVSDPFRLPHGPYGAGNRGLEYDTAPGTDVRAAADGEVTFAGVVAGARHVTVRHADGLKTTASHLASIEVVVGQRVRQGDVLGTTAGRLHFGARSGDAYLDPASLFAAGPVHVRLVPFDDPPGEGPAGERSAIRQLLGLGRAVVGGVQELKRHADAAIDWVGEHGGEAVRLALEYGASYVPYVRVLLDLGVAVDALLVALEQAMRPCTKASEEVAPPDERRIALLVGGLGSSSEGASVDDVDTAALGYEPADVLRFSYAGGRTPDPTDGLAGIGASTYDSVDTQQDLRESGRRLADLVQEVAASSPGVPIDLIAHSQGGLVARLAIAELERRGDARAVALLATIATPHGGSDVATAARLLSTSTVGEQVLRRAGDAFGDLDPTSTAVRQLSETSDLVAELGRTDLPAGLEAVSVAARSDFVVPVPRTALRGAPQAVVSLMSATAHSDLPGHRGTTRELLLALDGRPPSCKDLVEAVADHAVGTGISWTEDQLAPLVAATAKLGPLGLVP